MSIESELERLRANVAAAYAALSLKDGTLPAEKNSANLAEAIASIPLGVDTSDATAAATDIRSGKTAYVKGVMVTGAVPSQEAVTITPGTADQTAVAAGRFTTGAVTVAGDANLVAENIKSGVSIFGVTGTASAVHDMVIKNDSVVSVNCTYNDENDEVISKPLQAGASMNIRSSVIYMYWTAQQGPPGSQTSTAACSASNCTELVLNKTAGAGTICAILMPIDDTAAARIYNPSTAGSQ